jgi:hypothetical protein
MWSAVAAYFADSASVMGRRASSGCGLPYCPAAAVRVSLCSGLVFSRWRRHRKNIMAHMITAPMAAPAPMPAFAPVLKPPPVPPPPPVAPSLPVAPPFPDPLPPSSEVPLSLSGPSVFAVAAGWVIVEVTVVVVLALRTEVNVDTITDVDVLVTDDCRLCQYMGHLKDSDTYKCGASSLSGVGLSLIIGRSAYCCT